MLIQTRKKLTVDETVVFQECLRNFGNSSGQLRMEAQDAITDELERTKSRIIIEKEKLQILKSIQSKLS